MSLRLIFRMFIFLRFNISLVYSIDVYKLAPHFVKTIKWWSGRIMVSEFRKQKQRQRKRKCWLTAHWTCFFYLLYREIYYSSNIQLIYFVCLSSSSGIVLINMYICYARKVPAKEITTESERDEKIHKRFRNGGTFVK